MICYELIQQRGKCTCSKYNISVYTYCCMLSVYCTCLIYNWSKITLHIILFILFHSKKKNCPVVSLLLLSCNLFIFYLFIYFLPLHILVPPVFSVFILFTLISHQFNCFPMISNCYFKLPALFLISWFFCVFWFFAFCRLSLISRNLFLSCFRFLCPLSIFFFFHFNFHSNFFPFFFFFFPRPSAGMIVSRIDERIESK